MSKPLLQRRRKYDYLIGPLLFAAACSDGSISRESEATGTSITSAGGAHAGGSSGQPSTGTSSPSAATTGTPTGTTGGLGTSSGGSFAGSAGASTTSGAGPGTGTSAADGGSAGSGMSGVPCRFEVAHSVSEAIGTVGIVSFSTDLRGMTEAAVEFAPVDQGGRTLLAPVNLEAPEHRTLLLGMKSDRQYRFRILARAGEQECASEDYTLTTGALPPEVPKVAVEHHGGTPSDGFYVTSTGMGNGYGGENALAYIFDQDGDVVWWFEGPNACSRARMDYDGNRMWMLEANYPARASSSGLSWVSMDGLQRQQSLPGTGPAHHDFTVLPGGIIATMLWSGDCQSVVEVSPDGTIATVVEDVRALYTPGFECHGNAITYQAEAETYILSDRSVSVFVRFDRQGGLIWQFGGIEPVAGATLLPGQWEINHGHQLLPNGNFLFFNNDGPSGNSPVREFALDPEAGTADEVWSYEADYHSSYMGDVQRLSNGNTIITYSQQSTFREVDPEGNPIVTYTSDGAGAGYALFRPSLYGPPPAK